MYLPDDIFKLKLILKIIAFLFVKKKSFSRIALTPDCRFIGTINIPVRTRHCRVPTRLFWVGKRHCRVLYIIPVLILIPMLMRVFQGDGDGEIELVEDGVGEEELGDNGLGEGLEEGLDGSDFLRLIKAS